MEDLEAPLKKLAAYSMTLDGMPLPSCFADGLSCWSVSCRLAGIRKSPTC